MIDAYTIGITLALEDGVSEGILAIRRDLAALDTAIAASATQLLMLRELAAELPLPVQGRQMVRPAPLSARSASQKQPDQPSVEPADAAPIQRPAAPSATPTSSPPIIATLPGTEALSPPSRAAAPAKSQPPPAIERPVTSGPPPQAPSAPMVPPAVQPAPPTPPAAPVSVVQPASTAPTGAPAPAVPHVAAAPIAAPAPTAPMRPPSISPPPQPPELPNGRTDAPDFAAIARALAPIISAPTTGTPRQPEQLTTSPASPAAPSPIIMAVPPPEPLPRSIPQRQNAPPPATSASAPLPARDDAPAAASAPAPRASAAPVISTQIPQAAAVAGTREPNRSTTATDSAGAQETDRPAHAEVHLDGTLLGRWVTRHLERQVTRPQSGATGFDPRMTPSWSGAPIGN